jgi:CheY-like chemotaxis protein
MPGSYTVALVGFSQQEASTLEAFLRLAARRPPGYLVQDEVMDAQLLIVNADNPQAVHLVRHAELPGRVMLIGSSDAGTGWPLQLKPVKLVAVLAELDRMVGAQAAEPVASPRLSIETGFPGTEPLADTAASSRVPAGSRRSRDTEFLPTRPMDKADPPASSFADDLAASVAAAQAQPSSAAASDARALAAAFAQRPGVMRMTDFGGLDDLPMPTPRALHSRRSSDSLLPAGQSPAADLPKPARGDVLLVAESLVEGRNLLKRFKRYELSVDWSREPAQVQTMLTAHPYRLVVIDRLRSQADAFQVCRMAKQAKHGGRAPVVVMFAAIAGSMDRMKAGLAGCDAYLPRSISEAELYKTLAQHRLVNLNAFAKTNIGR